MIDQIIKVDLHIHTHSDGAVSVPELLEQIARASNLHVIAITDHDSIAGARQQTAGPRRLVGATSDGE